MVVAPVAMVMATISVAVPAVVVAPVPPAMPVAMVPMPIMMMSVVAGRNDHVGGLCHSGFGGRHG